MAVPIPTPTPGPAAANPQPDEHVDEHIFYNVLPEFTGNEAVMATRQPVNLPSPESAVDRIDTLPATPISTWKKFRLLIFPAIILVLALLGAIGYRHFKKSANQVSNQPTTTVNDNTAANLPTSNQNANDNTAANSSSNAPAVTTPADWQKRYFGSETCQDTRTCGDAADPDHDGLTNLEEFANGTDPNNQDSDGDGLGDGDELNIFGGSPLKSHTFGVAQYTDADFAKGGYDIATDKKYSPDKLTEIIAKVKQFGFHQATLTTLADKACSLYLSCDNPAPATSNQSPANAALSNSEIFKGVDQTPEAILARDSQRFDTIKKLGGALIKYQQDKKQFPDSPDFPSMVTAVKPYNIVATNPKDPINKDKYVYNYEVDPSKQDFTLSYFSETTNQLIKYHLKDAQKDASSDSAKANDEQRKSDLENIQSALLVYSSAKLDPHSNKEFVFPPVQNFKTALVPQYLSAIPKDPVSGVDYEYSVATGFDSFTLKAILQNPSTGTTGYLCNQVECRNY